MHRRRSRAGARGVALASSTAHGGVSGTSVAGIPTAGGRWDAAGYR
jgi:hypothetical protein